MSCSRLVCAYCAGPVAEGRCPVCRRSRSALHSAQLRDLLALLLLLAAIVTGIVLTGVTALALAGARA